MNARDYRPDIDGLRALAVLGVVFYHLGFPQLSGGFAGVDVFFVISGYLITKVITSGIEDGTFSFIEFYARRARRLFPALATTVAATFIIGALLFPVQVFELYSKSVVTTLFSVSNIYFWKESGYFDAGKELKPLLHTWSLSVEEQFYFVWPATLVLVTKLRRPWLVPALLVAIFVIGTAAAQYWLAFDQSGAFYLAPFRAGEFAIGGMCVWLMRLPRPGWMADEALALTGIALIVWTFVTYSEATPFPGLNALPPCIGAALLIYSGQARYMGRFLDNPLAQGLGLISYSLYLVHWPIIVFYSFWKITPLTTPEKWGIVAVSVALATLQYHFIERPIRWGARFGRPRLAAGAFLGRCVGLSVLLALPAAHSAFTGGWGFRPAAGQGPSMAQVKRWKKERTLALKTHCRDGGDDVCNPLAPHGNFLILGDSHALDGFNAFITAAPAFNYVMNSVGGCPPLAPQDLGLIKPAHPDRAACLKISKQRIDPNFLARFDVIAISVLFEWYTPEHLRHYLGILRANTKARLFIFGNYISLNRDCELIAVSQGLKGCIDPLNVRSFAKYDDELKALAKEFDAAFIAKSEILCGGGALENCRYEIDGTPFTYDKHHLTLPFALEIGKWIKQHYAPSLVKEAAIGR